MISPVVAQTPRPMSDSEAIPKLDVAIEYR